MTTYKDLLVHLDDARSCAGRIDAAVALAATWGAHLTGVYVIAEPEIPAYALGQIPRAALDAGDRAAAERAEVAAARFRAAADRGGVLAGHRVDRARAPEVADALAVHARYADLVVLGQVDPDDEPPAGGRHVAEQVILGSGRPALVVPYVGAPGTPGERVLVAWDAGREATRAVNDALPLLERAKAVTVLVVNPRHGRRGHGAEPGADLAVHLARHGVRVEVQSLEAREIGVADVILSRLADLGCDLLVMGAYGHARLRELVLGGVTRSILDRATVPVLMAH